MIVVHDTKPLFQNDLSVIVVPAETRRVGAQTAPTRRVSHVFAVFAERPIVSPGAPIPDGDLLAARTVVERVVNVRVGLVTGVIRRNAHVGSFL